MVLSAEPPRRSVHPSLTPTKPFDTIGALPGSSFHGRDTESAEARWFCEATSIVRPPRAKVLDVSPPPELSIAGLCSR